MCSNIGSIIGPIVGGLLADPAKNYPGWFGGIKWLEKHPYAPPNFLSAIFLMSAWLWVFFGLDEVGLYLHGLRALTNARDRHMSPSVTIPTMDERSLTDYFRFLADSAERGLQAQDVNRSLTRKNLCSPPSSHPSEYHHATRTNSHFAASSPTMWLRL